MFSALSNVCFGCSCWDILIFMLLVLIFGWIFMTTTGAGPGLCIPDYGFLDGDRGWSNFSSSLSDADILDSYRIVFSPDLVFEEPGLTSEGVDAVGMGSVQENLDKRFGEPLTSSDFSRVLENRIPKNTSTNTKWAVGVFRDWRKWRNFKSMTMLDDKWPIPNLKEGSFEKLDYWLARFITEVRRQDNGPYPAGMYVLHIYLMFCFIFIAGSVSCLL